MVKLLHLTMSLLHTWVSRVGPTKMSRDLQGSVTLGDLSLEEGAALSLHCHLNDDTQTLQRVSIIFWATLHNSLWALSAG